MTKLDMLMRGIARTPRRTVLRAVAGSGLGALAPTGMPRLPAGAKRKKKGKDRCPTCPGSCFFKFNEASGKTICGMEVSVKQSPCAPCTSSSDCLSVGNFPHCINSSTSLSTGQTVGLGVCQTTPTVGFFCANVSACVT